MGKIGEALIQKKQAIIQCNAEEVKRAASSGVNDAFVDRLTLTSERFDQMVEGVKNVQQLPDPVGKIIASWAVPSELQISKVSMPLGVIAVIYEARPNVTVDASALCFKSGNAVILRGGSECAKTNALLCDAMREGLRAKGIDDHAIQYIPDQSHDAVKFLLKMDEYVDVLISRGGKNLIKTVTQESAIPVFRHLDGICHTYIHSGADQSMAEEIIINAKLRRPGICGATETLLIDRACAEKFLPSILNTLIEKGCEVRGDKFCRDLDPRVKAATEEDWETEYLAPILSVKTVSDIGEAIQHINHYSSSHTEAIVTENDEAAVKFLTEVTSANVMHNCSTQFADGAEFGMGAEIGISTGKLHARGPVGLEQLTTFKYVVRGRGQIRS